MVISGFLGSGKTTLVRRLLEDAQRAGIVLGVVSNEFGELGIDAQLLGRAGEAYVELEGGCVCCQLSSELVETLQVLRERVRPARLVIETSGVGLPYDTQLHFFRPPANEWVGDSLAVVVVNAEQLLHGRDLEGTFEDQVTSADLLLLNKVDLVPEAVLPELEARLGELAPDAPIVPCVRARVPPALLFPPEPRARAEGRDLEPQPHAHEAFETREIRVPRGIPEDDLRTRLDAIGALRVKGFVETAAGPRLVQGVGPRIELEEIEAAPPGYAGRIVVITRSA